MSEETLFTEALEFADPAERAGFLDRVCAGKPDLRTRLDKLLYQHAQVGSFLGHSPFLLLTGMAESTTDRSKVERPGDRGDESTVGPYKLVEVIGEGGMGTVWLAQQHEPVKRLVALKVVKAGMDSKGVLTRFEAERQALALMDHPNIARVLDAGATADGRPYFVMELVKGVPITQFCDERRLSPQERLELFVPVCQAVQHAHQKGVIHRDIKPSNVLVALYDGRPVPKVIDFGLAKATGQTLTEKTLVTGLGAVVGTPEYMSPEQAELNQLDIDTRSDVYSLGVLLYELMTGTTPLQRKRVKEAALLEVLRLVREEEPPRPSTRLSTTDELPSIAANRGTEPAKLTRLMRGELDWIVMKALDKDRNRRYETAIGFAMDLQRYLADEPVLACPPSAAYRLRKFAQRNKGGLVVAMLVLFFLVLVGSGIGWALRDRTVRQSKVAGQVALILAEVERLEGQQRWPEALAAARRAEAAVASGEADAATAQRVRERVKEVELIDRLEQIRIAAEATNWMQSDQDYTRVFRDYGVDLEELAVEESVGRLKARPELAIPLAAALDHWVFVRAGLYEGDPTRWQRLVAVARGIDPEPLRDRLRRTWEQPVSQTQEELRGLAESIDVRTHHPATLVSLAHGLKRAKQVDSAIRLLRDARYAYPGDFWFNFELGVTLWTQKDLEGAIRFFSAAVSIRPSSAAAHNRLGLALRSHRKLDEAVACFNNAIRLQPENADFQIQLGYALGLQGKVNEAAAAYEKALRLEPDSASVHHAFGCFLRDFRNDFKGAVTSFHKAIELSPKYAATSAVYSDLCHVLACLGRTDEALVALEALRRSPTDHRDSIAHGLNSLAWALVMNSDPARRDPVRAVNLAREAVEMKPQEGPYHTTLGIALYRAGNWKAAIEALKRSDQLGVRKSPGYNAFYIAMAFWHLGNKDEARRWYDRAAEWMDKNRPFDKHLLRLRAEAGELLGVKDK